MIDIELNRVKGPSVKPLADIDIPVLRHSELDNGIPIIIFDSGTQDVLKIEAYFNKGIWHQTDTLSASMANTMLMEGTNSFDSKELTENIDFLGSHIDSGIDYHSSEVALYALRKHLPKSLGILKEILFNSTFPENNFKVQLQRAKQQFIVNQEKVSSRARKKFLNLLFGPESKYGQSATLNDFSEISRNSSYEYYKTVFAAENLKFIVAGKAESEDLQKLNETFGQIKFNTAENQSTMPKNHTHNGSSNINITGKMVQAAIRVGSTCIDHSDPDFFIQKILTIILGGYFGSRLMANIREDKGYTYGIGSNMVNYKFGGYFFISTEVGVEFVDDTLKEIKFEMKKLQNDLVPTDELERVKNYLLGSIMKGFDGPLNVSDRFHALMALDLDFSYYEKYIEEIKSISAQDILRVAQQKWDIERLITVVEG